MENFSSILALQAIGPRGIGRASWTIGTPSANWSSFLDEAARLKDSRMASLNHHVNNRSRLTTRRIGASETHGALMILRQKLTTLQSAAERLRVGSSGGLFTAAPSRVTSSNSNAVRIDNSPATLRGALEINVLQLADRTSGKKAIIEINGQEFSSDTNQFKNAGGVTGLNLTAIQTTVSSTTTRTIIPGTTATTSGPSIQVEAYNASADKLRLASTQGLSTGDAIKLRGGIPGIDADRLYYINVRGPDVALYDTRAHAQAGGSEGRIDIGRDHERKSPIDFDKAPEPDRSVDHAGDDRFDERIENNKEPQADNRSDINKDRELKGIENDKAAESKGSGDNGKGVQFEEWFHSDRSLGSDGGLFIDRDRGLQGWMGNGNGEHGKVPKFEEWIFHDKGRGSDNGGGFESVRGVSISQQTTTTTPEIVKEVTTTIKDPVIVMASGGGGTADPSKATAAIKEFVFAYNDVQRFLGDQEARGGALRGESSVRMLDTRLRQAFLGGFASSALSASLGSTSKHNLLSVEESKLQEGLTGDAESLAALFQNKSNGIAESTYGLTSSYLADNGPLEVRINSLASSIRGIDEQLERNARQIEKKREKILKAFDSMAASFLRVGEQHGFLRQFGSLLAV